MQTRKWQTKDGQDRYTTEIVADNMQMLGGRDAGAQTSSKSDYNQEPVKNDSAPKATDSNAAASSFDEFEDDIPF